MSIKLFVNFFRKDLFAARCTNGDSQLGNRELVEPTIMAYFGVVGDRCDAHRLVAAVATTRFAGGGIRLGLLQSVGIHGYSPQQSRNHLQRKANGNSIAFRCTRAFFESEFANRGETRANHATPASFQRLRRFRHHRQRIQTSAGKLPSMTRCQVLAAPNDGPARSTQISRTRSTANSGVHRECGQAVRVGQHCHQISPRVSTGMISIAVEVCQYSIQGVMVRNSPGAIGYRSLGAEGCGWTLPE